MREARPGSPSVFISSTHEDLKEYRERAKDASVAAGLRPEMSENFEASGHRKPLDECLARVRQCDVLVVIVAHRYGFKPPKRGGKSITWLECLEAEKAGLEVLAFIVEDNHPWPPNSIDSPKKPVKNFKGWLDKNGIRNTFTTPEDLHHKVDVALREWKIRHPEPDSPPQSAQADPAQYLLQLRELCSWIDIRGLQVGTGQAHRFPIEELYIPLTMANANPGRVELPDRRSVPLEEALAHPRLVIVGDPGSGKTTFLRHIALQHANQFEQGQSHDFPVFIRVSELLAHIRRRPENLHAADAPSWLIDFLAARSAEFNQGLSEAFFREVCHAGPALLMLDGLDEAPNAKEREAAVRLFENATRAFSKCRFVVTTRPRSYVGRTVLAGFQPATIEPLESAAIQTFLSRWCAALFPGSPASARNHLAELDEALRRVPEIRRMARNPVMLTALAVVHWNEHRLPEQRAELYESIVLWLARAREQREGRASVTRCLELLSQLALAMQSNPSARLVDIEKGSAAALLSSAFSSHADSLAFVEEEEVDSGIIVSRDASVRYWHLTFQEYLAARAIAGMEDTEVWKVLLDGERIYAPEWREMVLLLAGVLCGRQGPGKVNALLRAVLDRLGPNANLAAQARCAGLLGCIVNDLAPLHYQPADPRYRQLMDAVLGIFDKDKAAEIDFKVRLEAAEALGQAGDPRLNHPNWIPIKGKRGLPDFEIGKYPVTVAEYKAFVDGGGYEDESFWPAGGFGQRDKPDEWEDQLQHPTRPVVYVTWYEASAYARWAGARLLSEKDWEWAARGSGGREYPWGDKRPDATRANYDQTGPQHTTPVGLYPCGATPEGVQDMVGNVWEWVQDWFDKEKKAKVLRGGSFSDLAGYLRASVRGNIGPGFRDVSIGFRLARDVRVP
jgi:hypothetical protein